MGHPPARRVAAGPGRRAARRGGRDRRRPGTGRRRTASPRCCGASPVSRPSWRRSPGCSTRLGVTAAPRRPPHVRLELPGRPRRGGRASGRRGPARAGRGDRARRAARPRRPGVGVLRRGAGGPPTDRPTTTGCSGSRSRPRSTRRLVPRARRGRLARGDRAPPPPARRPDVPAAPLACDTADAHAVDEPLPGSSYGHGHHPRPRHRAAARADHAPCPSRPRAVGPRDRRAGHRPLEPGVHRRPLARRRHRRRAGRPVRRPEPLPDGVTRDVEGVVTVSDADQLVCAWTMLDDDGADGSRWRYVLRPAGAGTVVQHSFEHGPGAHRAALARRAGPVLRRHPPRRARRQHVCHAGGHGTARPRGGGLMRYMLLICTDPAAPAVDEAAVPDIDTWVDEMDRRDIRQLGEVLAPSADATTVRVRDGQRPAHRRPLRRDEGADLRVRHHRVRRPRRGHRRGDEAPDGVGRDDRGAAVLDTADALVVAQREWGAHRRRGHPLHRRLGPRRGVRPGRRRAGHPAVARRRRPRSPGGVAHDDGAPPRPRRPAPTAGGGPQAGGGGGDGP